MSQVSSSQISNSRALISNVFYDLAYFQISSHMMLVSRKVVSTRKHQENVPKEEEKHYLQYNALANSLECAVREERRVPAQMEKGTRYTSAHRHADLPFIFHWCPDDKSTKYKENIAN